MSSTSITPLPVLNAAPQDDDAMPPELDDQNYCEHVLLLRPEQTEDALDEDLIRRATALGIAVDRPDTPDRLHPSGAQSAITIPTDCVRTTSTSSDDSASTAPTSHSSPALSTPATAPAIGAPPLTTRQAKGLSFSQYDKYLAKVDPNLAQPKLQPLRPSTDTTRSNSIFSPSARKGYRSIKEGIKFKVGWKKHSSHRGEPRITCIGCREDFQIDETRILQCGHNHCANCLNTVITQAMTDESKMPPRCCTQPIPSSVIKATLPKGEHEAFLKAVLQFSTPWETRMFCPNAACNEFIPQPSKIDPKRPFETACRNCDRRVCVMCKRNAHELGQDCPDDWELDAVLKMGEKSGWRRCYKCRTLVELTAGSTHMTCQCEAQFCYICGAVWDPVVGCPNFCNGEEELDRRRGEEEARIAEEEAGKIAREAAAAAELAERAEAEKRTRECKQLNDLFKEQEQEMQRFQEYQKIVRWEVWLRHGEQKRSLKEKYEDLNEKMKERHAKTVAHLEDRQVAAEMDLRASQEHHEKSVRIRLKYMEAYCNAEGTTSPGENLPPRKVTEKDLRELGQQYNLRDDMERLHQAKINVMRDQQAKRMEELLERQEAEFEKLAEKNEEEMEDLAAEFAHKVDMMAHSFNERKERLSRRWELALEIRRVELQEETGLKYAPMHPPEWPSATGKPEYPLLFPPVEG